MLWWVTQSFKVLVIVPIRYRGEENEFWYRGEENDFWISDVFFRLSEWLEITVWESYSYCTVLSCGMSVSQCPNVWKMRLGLCFKFYLSVPALEGLAHSLWLTSSSTRSRAQVGWVWYHSHLWNMCCSNIGFIAKGRSFSADWMIMLVIIFTFDVRLLQIKGNYRAFGDC